ncbi:Hypothetical protein FKW44_014010 [Caligus rogercresseyi]|uniref:Uncharacterized protein n=1 Tax=Caligus rogercresseyi TaxID=217165 RepID=A0A7T8GYC9_CALRO|nr:Hypothetical protein FKW44_014010 [Caligus rogercresseyi]
MMIIAKSVLRPWGHQDRRFVAEVRGRSTRTAKVLHQFGRRDGLLQANHRQHHQQGLGYSSYKKMILTEGTRASQEGQGSYHWSPDLLPPSSPDCNPLDYFLWGMVENKTNKHAHKPLPTPQGCNRGGVRQYEEGRRRQGLQAVSGTA